MVLKSLMEINQKSQQDIAALLEVSKGYISEVLNYKKRLSSEGIRVLADHFAIQQEALNREYELIHQSSGAGRRKKIAPRVRSYRTRRLKAGRIVIESPSREGKTPKHSREVSLEKPSRAGSVLYRK
jgi:plasmid maintenance system antidote protein VapI